ncbi:DNA-3-methyladenine glycosylase [Lutimonas saemankumensis]|uniref:DNA-3-methyladenine glycosylase family protein n=1 Tax=Lutimonas saemankumensis TaxID=483016 RepID=UPI001CD48C0D|nr:DNA-3-methyladenine glycosylase [Lutimonas saemankumensis]MCA0931098.1 DNA-3-methyladenine glycosylase [Lutimonas saemankumensis]
MISPEKIIEHYKRDKLLFETIKNLDIQILPEPNVDIYHSLVASIVSQQLSTKVVKVIWGRFTGLFADGYPDPESLLSIEHQVLRGVGLSNSKASYVKNVAEFSLNNDMSFEFLQQKGDEEIIEYLSQIKGVGRWTVQMILMFPMDRPNIFPVDDLGIQNAMKKIYGLELEKKELKVKMIEIASVWQPYRSLASKYLWKYLGT